MIRMTGIRKVYRSGLVATEALTDFTLHVKRGELVSLMGPSGSGKTTFLNVAGLLDVFDEGEYLLDGVRVRDLGDRELARLRNERIGFVFQTFNLIPDLDVAENVELPLRYRRASSRERRVRVERALAQVGLEARRHQYPAALSGGQQQRVALARALVTDPALILADEPTGNLDSVMAREVMRLLEEVCAAGRTVVMVTHSAELAARAHRRLHVLDGKLVDPWARRADAERAGGPR